ncbi:type VI secretion system protein TssA [Thaumasiovibrio sp. DFM-14]|uniref:type VI secretion system protein TssA n=1 Tax=Thaumasiovibrio sp. DFM-14 TaxID=3384792 RepID=UPI00399FEAD3
MTYSADSTTEDEQMTVEPTRFELPKKLQRFSELLDINRLLEPISEASPCGSDLRQDIGPTSAYYRLKDIRSQARSAERDALIDGEPLLSLAHLWRPLAQELPDIIATQSKDFELLAWLIEANTRIYGFGGLAMSYLLTAQLIERYWDGIFPLVEDDDQEERVSALIGLNGVDGEGTLLMPISCIALTEDLAEGEYSLWEYQQANDISRLDTDKRQQKIDAGGVALDDLERAVKASSSPFYQALLAEINVAIDAYAQAVGSIDLACQLKLPSSNISKRLQDFHDAIVHLAGDKLQALRGGVEPDDAEEVTDVSEQHDTVTGNIQQREQAIVQLIKIADFFRQTEPHSPVSYSIDQIVRWCDMSLPELLAELIDSGDAREGYFRLVGIVKDDSNSKS